MSRIPSSASSGVQVASSPSNSIYTLLLIIAAAASIAATVYMGTVLSERYNFIMPAGDQYEKAKAEPVAMLKQVKTAQTEVIDAKYDLNTLGTAAAPGATGAAPAPAAPAEAPAATPPAAAPAAPAAPAAAPVATPPAAPAPAAAPAAAP